MNLLKLHRLPRFLVGNETASLSLCGQSPKGNGCHQFQFHFPAFIFCSFLTLLMQSFESSLHYWQCSVLHCARERICGSAVGNPTFESAWVCSRKLSFPEKDMNTSKQTADSGRGRYWTISQFPFVHLRSAASFFEPKKALDLVSSSVSEFWETCGLHGDSVQVMEHCDHLCHEGLDICSFQPPTHLTTTSSNSHPFPHPAQPRPMLSCGRSLSMSCFRPVIYHISIHTGDSFLWQLQNRISSAASMVKSQEISEDLRSLVATCLCKGRYSLGDRKKCSLFSRPHHDKWQRIHTLQSGSKKK